jgi:hypothetical protein
LVMGSNSGMTGHAPKGSSLFTGSNGSSIGRYSPYHDSNDNKRHTDNINRKNKYDDSNDIISNVDKLQNDTESTTDGSYYLTDVDNVIVIKSILLLFVWLLLFYVMRDILTQFFDVNTARGYSIIIYMFIILYLITLAFSFNADERAEIYAYYKYLRS